MARQNFSIRALYNITKNQDNPIKTVGRDSFLSPKTPKNTSFLGVIQPQGVAQPLYSRGHNQTRTRNMCPSLIQIGSKTAEKTLHKQTDRQSNRHYENNGHLAVNQFKLGKSKYQDFLCISYKTNAVTQSLCILSHISCCLNCASTQMKTISARPK